MSGLEFIEARELEEKAKHDRFTSDLSINAAAAAWMCMKHAPVWSGKKGTKETYVERWNRHRKAALLRRVHFFPITQAA